MISPGDGPLEHDAVYDATKSFVVPIGDVHPIPAPELVDVAHMGTVAMRAGYGSVSPKGQ